MNISLLNPCCRHGRPRHCPICNFREIRLDIHVLNHEGNVADCAGVAGLAALAHFKRPDVSLEGDIVKVT